MYKKLLLSLVCVGVVCGSVLAVDIVCPDCGKHISQSTINNQSKQVNSYSEPVSRYYSADRVEKRKQMYKEMQERKAKHASDVAKRKSQSK